MSVKRTLLLLLLCAFVYNAALAQSAKQRAFYQITVYHYNDTMQESIIEDYLQHALLPTLHSMDVKHVGVFKAMSNDTATDKKIYLFMPVNSLSDIADIGDKLATNTAYLRAGERYLDAPYDKAPYTRMENILLRAFELAPQMEQPHLKGPKSERVYEMRSYEGATEKLYLNKVKMFNAGDEIGIFAKLDFNPVFYGEVLAGSRMPNLMYMTTFENMAEREKHWKAFGESPEFKSLLAMPEYQHNVSKADIIFLRPTEYSDI